MAENHLFDFLFKGNLENGDQNIQKGHSKRRDVALDRNAVAVDLKGQCGCTVNCYSKFTVGEILFWRQKIHSLPEGPQRMTKIIEVLKLAAVNMEKHEKSQKYRVDQKLICRKTMICLILKISVATFTRARSDALRGVAFRMVIPKNETRTVKGKICEGFIKTYVTSVCDQDPTQERYRMPSCLNRCDIFSMYENLYPEEHLKKSKFYKILKDKFKDLSFNKCQRFTKCTECSDFRYLIENEKDPYQRSCLEAALNQHLLEQQIEREAYYVRRAQAEMRPNQFLSLILDGMDQNKTDLPHFAHWNTPNNAGTQKLRTHITGSIVHGRGKYCFVDFNEFQHNTNLTLSCLLNILQKESKDGQLPPTLYVQLDNTTRENKNKYFIGMIAYLVKKKIIFEAFISFLIVGHTHEDVDQMFSKVSHGLKTQNAITVGDLASVVTSSQQPNPRVESLKTVWNISEWLEPCINQVHNVTFPKMYRLYNDETGHTTVKFKVLSSDPVWRPLPTERPLEIFKMDAHGQQIIPDGMPQRVEPSVDEHDWRELKGSLKKDFKLAQFTAESVAEWNEFLSDPFADHCQGAWPLGDLRDFKEPERAEIGEKERAIIEKYKQKRQMMKEVYTAQSVNGSRGRHQDRRYYEIGQMIIVQKESNTIVIGKVEDVQENNDVVVRKCKKVGLAYVETEETETFPVEKCFPGTFSLTNSGGLPQRIRNRIASNIDF